VNGESAQEEVHDRADPERERRRPDPGRATEGQPGDEHDKLQPGAGDRDGEATASQAGHQPVTRAGSESRPDVQPAAGTERHDARRQHCAAYDDVVHLRYVRPDEIDDDADEDGVEDGADTWPDAQGDPGQQNEEAEEHDDGPDRDARPAADALVQHIPRGQTELGIDDRGEPDAAHHESDHAARQTLEHAIPWHWLDATDGPPARPRRSGARTSAVTATTHLMIDRQRVQ